MKIIIPNLSHSDVEDYAAFRGVVDAVLDKYSSTLFNFQSSAAREVRAVYELSYLMEQESKQFEDSCDFEIEGIVHSYSDLKGWGKIYSDDLLGLLDFSYHNVETQDFISEGMKVVVRFKKTHNGKIHVISVKEF